MVRRTDVRRDSVPVGPALFNNPEEKARLEAKNGLLQWQAPSGGHSPCRTASTSTPATRATRIAMPAEG